MRIVAAIVALCAALFLLVVGRHWWIADPRQASQRAIGIAILVLLASTMVAAARPSPYPSVTPFNGDRYASAQMGADVVRAIGCPPPCSRGKKLNKRAAAAQRLHPTRRHAPLTRQKWRGHVPLPASRPVTSEAYRVEAPLSIGEGIRREAARVIGRPAAWCGWWLGQHLGMPFRHLWLARNWAKVGSSAGGPRVGAIVVWRHHVGIITGREGSLWVVKSGNDGRRVRERPRSVAGAIAFRMIGGRG